LSMEHVDGFDLGKLMSAAKQKGAKIPPLVCAFIVSEAAKGLHYAHERKDERGMPLAIVHRDVSPQNILLSHEGVVKIADFGIATANLFREETGVLKGKFGYMSPEQARGEKVDRRSDIYALGVVFYEMLTLRSPYGKLDDDALLAAVKNGSFEPPSAHVPEVPPELEAIVMRALSRSAGDRFQTARDMAGAIARVLLAKQELVDNASVEATLAHLLGRDLVLPSTPPPGDAQPQTMAAVPLAQRIAGEGAAEQGTSPHAAGPRVVREVRHIAVVTLRIQGVEALGAALGAAAAQRSALGIRAILDEIAYKRHAVWSWESAHGGGPRSGEAGHGASPLGSARAIVGLLDNPSRAPAEAASLAIDVHEALAGASEDLPAPLSAAIGIVRGIATGERDGEGHLIHHILQEPVNFLADQVGSRAPFGATWVAGGVYRLVRRDFRWNDAPAIDIEDAGSREVPRQMRLYRLLRPLTREERLDEMAFAPSDLVGRDAEKADLHAAFHRSLNLEIGGDPSPPPRQSDLPPVRGSEPSLGPSRAAASIPPQASQASQPNASRSPRGELSARVITGEMGIGKTALVSAFLAELPPATRTLQVECSPVKNELPLSIVCDLLRIVTELGLDDTLEAATAKILALLGPQSRSTQSPRVVARLAELVTGKQREHGDEDAVAYGRDLVLAGARSLLASLARSGPLVIVVDGLQWADRASMEILHELLRLPGTLPILALLVTRPDEHVAPYIEGLVRIELRGLSAEEQMRLVEARLGVREGVAAVCGELVPRVAGNPFFLLEMIDALLERGTLEIVEQSGNGWAKGGPDQEPVSGRSPLALVRHERPSDRAEALPSTLEQLIGDRLRELPSAEHDVVDWLAVAGGPLQKDTLLSLTRLADDEAITRLCARGLCDRKGSAIDFRHPLARDVAYLALDPANRARMHRLLGEHLAET
ncbi:MAG: protein kinase, partial [Minicystis sp.]